MTRPDARFGRRAVYAGAVLIGLNYAINGNYESGDPVHVVLLVAGAFALLAIVRDWLIAGPAALVYSVIVGLDVHLSRALILNGSDVLAATNEAINVLGAGSNPYGHIFSSTIPPGSPFPYFPGEIAFYGIWKALFGTVLTADRVAGTAIVLMLAGFAPFVGLEFATIATALYGASAFVAYRATDGSNDTALAFLIVLALWLLTVAQRVAPKSRLRRVLFAASGIVFGWALAFKLFTFFVFPYVVAYLRAAAWPWQKYLAYGVGTFIAFSLPFFVWDPAGFVHNVILGLFFHQNVWGSNVWAALRTAWPGAVNFIAPGIPFIQLAAIVYVVSLTSRSVPRSLGGAVLAGCAVLLTAFLFGRWSTYTYYSFLAALVAAGTILALGRAHASSEEL